ncbi:MAG: hypothetical protein Cpurp_14340 [Chlorogloea purpurea SAG 13.99]|nr:hypothetical protein [Chlorogloea purpurea SAG 13.99]
MVVKQRNLSILTFFSEARGWRLGVHQEKIDRPVNDKLILGRSIGLLI